MTKKQIDGEEVIRLSSPNNILPQNHPNLIDQIRYYPKTFCEEMQDLELYGPQVSIFDKNNKLLTSVSHEWGKHPKDNWAIKEKFDIELKDILETTIILASTGAHNFYHFIVDLVPRIRLLKKFDKDIFNKNYPIVTNTINTNFHKEYFKAFGINLNNCVTFPNKDNLGNPILAEKFGFKFKNAILPSSPGVIGVISPKTIDFINEHIKPSKDFSKGEKIFLNRKGGTTRDLENLNEIENFLIEKGFTSINASDFSLQEQASIFYNAKIIVSAHGSALTNIMYCKPDTTIIEFFNTKYVIGSFHAMSNFKKLNYNCIIGNGEDWVIESRLIGLHENINTSLKNVKEVFKKLNI